MTKMPKNTKKNQKPGFLHALISKPERDREYMSDLNNQWDQLDKQGRIKFVLGAVAGAIIFFSALGLVLWLISLMMS